MNASAQRIALFCRDRPQQTAEGDASVLGGTSPELENGKMVNAPERRTVFIQGYWDLLHCGYLDLLEEIRRRETAEFPNAQLFLICGVLHERDEAVRAQNANEIREDAAKYKISSAFSGHTIFQSVHERGLMLLSLRLVDDVIFDVQNAFTTKFKTALGIQRCYAVSNHFDFDAQDCDSADVVLNGEGVDSTRTILGRFVDNKLQFIERRKAKIEPELAVKGEKTVSVA